MRESETTLRSGAVGGVLAASVLIVVFFFIDLARGEPLATPAFLSRVLAGNGALEPNPVLMTLYTVAHYLVFVILGIVAAALRRHTALPANLFVGAAYGLFACSLVFYPALVIAGGDVLRAPSWPWVFLGNVLAGITIFAWLRWSAHEGGLFGVWDEMLGSPVLREGIAAGLIGASVVAFWFLILDFVGGRPLYTPAALGSAILYGAQAAGGVRIEPAPVLGYTLIHGAAFLLAGVVLAALVRQVERFPPLVFGLVLAFVVFETFFIFVVALLGFWIMEQLAWWSVLIGNLLAAGSMGGYLWRRHPKLKTELREEILWGEP